MSFSKPNSKDAKYTPSTTSTTQTSTSTKQEEEGDKMSVMNMRMYFQDEGLFFPPKIVFWLLHIVRERR